MKVDYEIYRTETADLSLRKIILYIASNFSNDVALSKLDEIEAGINRLSTSPYLGALAKEPVLKRKGYRVLVLEKNYVFYKIEENRKRIIVSLITDQRQDYLGIIRGL